MARLRVVTPDGEEPDQSFDVAARALLDRVLSEHPVGLCIVYETAEKITWATVPQSEAMARGLIETAADVLDEIADDK